MRLAVRHRSPFVRRSLVFATMMTAAAFAGSAWAQSPGNNPGPAPGNNAGQQANDKQISELKANGHKVFMAARCYACHGQMGFGGVGPRFRNDRFLGLTDYVVGQILVGRGIMPSFAEALNDQQIAAVATYIRNNWGNQFGAVHPQEVAKARNEVKLKPESGPQVYPTGKAYPTGQPPNVPVPPYSLKPPGQALPPQTNEPTGQSSQ